ncbi:MAG TPA: TetR family transcriptional regulator [Pilimelia sp.]|nr:TetR family transcriptional regulator [Pilimelia sp.]
MTAAADLHQPPARPPISRRERKKRETRAALESAALRLFAEKGYEQTTVDEIAEAANVAVRTFFRYFSSKQHVLFGDIAHHHVARMRAAFAARPRDEPAMQGVRAVLDQLEVIDPSELGPILTRMRLMARQPSLRGIYLALNDELRQVIVDFVAQRTGLSPTDDPYPLLVGSAAMSSWDVALTIWTAAGGRGSLGDLRRTAFDTLVAGLAPPTGDLRPQAGGAPAQPTRRNVAR